MVESAAARIDHKDITQVLRKNLVGMADDDYIVIEWPESIRPIGNMLGLQFTKAVQQFDATVTGIRWMGVHHINALAVYRLLDHGRQTLEISYSPVTRIIAIMIQV